MATTPFGFPAPEMDDRKRTEVLKAFHILDSDQEPIFDRLTQFAQTVARTSMAAISLIDEDRQWFKSSIGLPVQQTDRVISFCTHTIKQDHPFIVEDATLDPLFRDNPLVIGPPYIHFYAGIPLITSDGYRIGSLAVMDQKPRRINQSRLSILQMLAEQVMTHIDLRRQRHDIAKILSERETVNRQLVEQAEHLREAQRIGKIGSWEMELPSRSILLSEETFRIFGVDFTSDLVPISKFMSSVHREDRRDLEIALENALAGSLPLDLTHRIVRPKGEVCHVHQRGELKARSNGKTILAGTVQDVTNQVEAENRIRDLAFFDSLTGLPNRRFILDRIEKMVSMRQRMAYDAAVLFIDLDNFKSLNDTFGHDKGDLLLKEVAHRLQSCVRSYDNVGRFGGDEFVVLLERVGDNHVVDAAHAFQVAQKIIEAMSQSFNLDGLQHRTSPSIGIALIDGEILSKEELLKRADMAMYKAKAEGRNTIRFYSPELQSAVAERAELEAELRRAIDQKEFYLNYQPQINADGQMTGVEALLRWDSSKRGMVPTSQFIMLAEDLGLIMPIGAWVLEEACRQIAQWSNVPFLKNLSMSVNVSVRQFYHPDFVGQVIDALSRTGADPYRLKLEITESMLIKDYEATRKKMMDLKATGIRFSLDDFGTGCSSLSHLKRLPIDQLKIDQSFVQHIVRDTNDATITRSIISLSRNLGLDVIAEGVETEDQRQFLINEGCVNFQGFLYHPALAASDIAAYLNGKE